MRSSASAPVPAQVVQLVTTVHEKRRLSSGYLVGDNLVLTVAHSVKAAARPDDVTVRFHAGAPQERTVTAERLIVADDVDLALVILSSAPVECRGPVRFGAAPRQGQPLEFQAVGHPGWKLRTLSGRRSRVTYQAAGSLAPMSNAGTGTLELTLAGPPPDGIRDGMNPWEGYSGSAVWVDDHLIGVVAEQNPAESYGRLVAIRLERVYAVKDESKRAALITVLGLPPEGELPVVPVRSESTLLLHQLSAREIGPKKLRDREDELAELEDFCRTPERYGWWVAPPWSGKTALAAWFASRPPPDLDVVSFFVTARIRGQSTSPDFLDTVLRQLADLAAEPTPALTDTQSWVGTFHRLLAAAARRSEHRSRVLVLLIDGLDEDLGAHPHSGLPSIASLLPREPPPNLRIILTSRTNPGVPSDVADMHPLHNTPWRELRPSPHAQGTRRAAQRELLAQLSGEAVNQQIVGLLAAAGGGLTLDDLHGLLRLHRGEPVGRLTLEALLGSAFARSLQARRRTSVGADRIYLLAHEELQSIAETELGDALEDYLRTIHRWADGYRRQQWPENTPTYLLRPYGDLLAHRGEIVRLSSLALDQHRHERLWAASHSDLDAINENAAARRLMAASSDGDIVVLTELAIWGDRLTARNGDVPPELPSVWIALDRPEVALTLARGIKDRVARCGAMAEAAVIATGALAEQLMQEAVAALNVMDENADRPDIAVRIAVNLARAGSTDAGVRLVESLSHPVARSVGLLELVRLIREDGRDDDAAELSTRIEDGHVRALLDGPEARTRIREAVDRQDAGLPPPATAAVAAEVQRLDMASARRLLELAVAAARTHGVGIGPSLALAGVAALWRARDSDTADMLVSEALERIPPASTAQDRYNALSAIARSMNDPWRAAVRHQAEVLRRGVPPNVRPHADRIPGLQPSISTELTYSVGQYARVVVDVLIDGRLDEEALQQLRHELDRLTQPQVFGPPRPAALVSVIADLVHIDTGLSRRLADHAYPPQWQPEMRAVLGIASSARRDNLPRLRRRALAGDLDALRAMEGDPVTQAELIRLCALSGSIDNELLRPWADRLTTREIDSDQVDVVAALLSSSGLRAEASHIPGVDQVTVASSVGRQTGELLWAKDVLLPLQGEERDWTLLRIAGDLAAVGQHAAVAEINPKLPPAHRAMLDAAGMPTAQPEPLLSWAIAAQAQRNSMDRIGETADLVERIGDPVLRADTLRLLARRLRAHDPDHADRLLAEAIDAWRELSPGPARTRMAFAIIDDCESSQALGIARGYTPAPDSPGVLARIAGKLVRQGANDTGIRLYETALDHLDQLAGVDLAVAQANLATSLISWGRAQAVWHAAEAEARVAALGDSVERSRGLAALAVTLRGLDPARSCATARQALDAAAQPVAPWRWVLGYAEVGAVLHDIEPGLAAHAFASALSAAANTGNTAERCRLQLILAARMQAVAPLRAAALWHSAETTLARAAGTRERAGALARVARDVVDLDRNRAMQLANQSEALCRMNETTEPDPDWQESIAKGFANVGEFETAAMIADALPPQRRPFMAFAVAAARAGALSESTSLARHCPLRRQREVAREAQVAALAQRGGIGEAQQLAGQLHTSSSGWRVLTENLGRMDARVQQAVLDRAQSDFARSRSLNTADAFTAICVLLAEINAGEAALSLYQTMPRGPDRSAALARLAYALAAHGKEELAHAVVRDTTADQAETAEAEAAIAVGLGYRGSSDAGHLRRLLKGIHWARALEAIAFFRPDALRRIAAAMNVRIPE
ncbi:trypsin-like serine protease [Actinoplanes aureus]|uniref:Trypsin-like serine protease n=1 Tax=Actinoplanes aureus TaxID=2792083 RepID=A0A931G3I6_9ACTN|nr:trypsin-like serine protease [Actinoplanes aureus]MBG0567046.1 trypsin-like serine protease [Actinoplanes aureus]